MKVQLQYKYLSYDIQLLVDKYLNMRVDDNEKKFEANLRDDEEDEGNLIKRLIATATSRLHLLLEKYLQRVEEDGTDALTDDSSWDYVFLGSVHTDGKKLAHLMHWCVVRWVMSAWCKMQNDLRGSESEDAEYALLVESLQTALHRGMMPRKEKKEKPVDQIFVVYE